MEPGDKPAQSLFRYGEGGTWSAGCGKTPDNAYYPSCSSDGSTGLGQPKTVPEQPGPGRGRPVRLLLDQQGHQRRRDEGATDSGSWNLRVETTHIIS